MCSNHQKVRGEMRGATPSFLDVLPSFSTFALKFLFILQCYQIICLVIRQNFNEYANKVISRLSNSQCIVAEVVFGKGNVKHC